MPGAVTRVDPTTHDVIDSTTGKVLLKWTGQIQFGNPVYNRTSAEKERLWTSNNPNSSWAIHQIKTGITDFFGSLTFVTTTLYATGLALGLVLTLHIIRRRRLPHAPGIPYQPDQTSDHS